MARFVRNFQELSEYTSINLCSSLLSKIPFPVWEQLILPVKVFMQTSRIVLLPYNTFPLLLLLSRKTKILVIHDLMFINSKNSILTVQYWKNFYRSIFCKIGIRGADKIITVSGFSKSQIAKHFPNVEHKIFILNNTCAEQFEEESVQTVEMGSSAKREKILFVSGSTKEKNLEFAIRALSRMSPQYEVAVVGISSQFANVLRQKYNLDFDIYYSISDRELIDLYHQAKLLVVPSIIEGFCIPLIEAMKCSTPILASKASCIPEIGGDVCCYFDPHDELDFITKLKLMLGKPVSEKRKADLIARYVENFSRAATQIKINEYLMALEEEHK